MIGYKIKLRDRKMKPYVGEGKYQMKWVGEAHDGLLGTTKGITKTNKLEAKNANRSLKKSERQHAKKEIQEQL